MGKYCDPKMLERVWLGWIVANHVPELEPLRETGLLWVDPHKYKYCVASSRPYEFELKDGICTKSDLEAATRASFFPLDLILTRRLADGNYLQEVPINDSWGTLTSLIYKICSGVALNFRPPTEDIKDELIHEAFIHTLTKIQRGKLKFDPGKAPAFNLLTTAIFRIMYSIKNKEKRDRDHRSTLADQLLDGVKLPELNSIRVSRSLVGNATQAQY